MRVRIEAIAMSCRDERRLSAFWTGALGYEVALDQPGDWMVLRPKRDWTECRAPSGARDEGGQDPSASRPNPDQGRARDRDPATKKSRRAPGALRRERT